MGRVATTFYTSIASDKNKIYVRGYKKNGELLLKEEDYFAPSLFRKSDDINSFYKGLRGEPLEEIKFDDSMEMYRYCKEFADSEELWGVKNPIMQYMHYNFFNCKPDLSLIHVAIVDIETLSGYIMPKATEAPDEITAICWYDTVDDFYYVFTTAKWDAAESKFAHLAVRTKYFYYEDEEDMLMGFLNRWSNYPPDVMSGWNSEFFDYPYITFRIEKILGEKKVKYLSPFRKINKREVRTKWGTETCVEYVGIQSLDYKDLYQKFTYGNPESMKLGYIGELELGDDNGKVEFEYETYEEFYKKDPQLFIDYNIKDVNIIVRLDKKLHLFNLCFMVSYRNNTNFGTTLGTTNPWYSYIYNSLMEEHIVVPYDGNRSKKKEEFEGAFVFPVVEGMLQAIASFDVNSLYPNLMISYNISPETILETEERNHVLSEIKALGIKEINSLIEHDIPFIEYYLEHDGMPKEITNILNKYNITMSPNWQFYTREFQGIIPKLVSGIYDNRVLVKAENKEFKKQKETLIESKGDASEIKSLGDKIDANTAIEKGLKYQINGLYGATGCVHFQLYDIRNARAVTLSGQLLIQIVANNISKYIMSICDANNIEIEDKWPGPAFIAGGDTDSVYVDISPFAKTKKSSKTFPSFNRNEKIDFYDKVCKIIEKKAIQPSFDNLANNLYLFKSDNLKMKRENIAAGINENNGAGFWMAKKHYWLSVDDSEGVRYDVSHPKAMGLCFQQTTYAKIFRKKMKEACQILVEKGASDARKFVNEFVVNVRKMDLSQLSLIRGVNNIEKYTAVNGLPGKGAGIHVKAAINFNWLINHLGLENKYTPIHSGSKIRFVYLKDNPYHFNVIGFIDKLPEEFGLSEFIDFDMILEKSFMKPLGDIFEAIGSSIEEKFEVEELFS